MQSAKQMSDNPPANSSRQEFSVTTLHGSGSVLIGDRQFSYHQGDCILNSVENPHHKIFVTAASLASNYVKSSPGTVFKKLEAPSSSRHEKLPFAQPGKAIQNSSQNLRTPDAVLDAQGNRSIELLRAYDFEPTPAVLRRLLGHRNGSFAMSAIYALGLQELKTPGSVPQLAEDLNRFRKDPNGSLRVARLEVLTAIPRLAVRRAS